MSAMSANRSKIENVVVLVAMEAEAKPFIDHLALAPFKLVTPNLPCVAFQGTHKGCVVTVVTNGQCARYAVDNVGTTPAALAAFGVINELKPDLLINAGTAGGFKSADAHIGDAFISTHMRHHDRRIMIPGTQFEEYGRGNHAAQECPKLTRALSLKCGVVTTSNSLDHHETDLRIMKENSKLLLLLKVSIISAV